MSVAPDAENAVDTTAPFELVGSFSTRKDISRRKEIKFALPGADVGGIRQILQTRCHRVSHNESVSQVRSVYFDDGRLSACHANIDGLGNRQKVRMRWYDALRPQHQIFMEIKWRTNRVTGKHRFELASQKAIESMSYREIIGGMRSVVPEEQLAVILRYSEPTVLVEYKRQHFHADHGQMRLTIDYDIRFYDQFGKRMINTRFGQPLQDFVVVEAKAPVGQEVGLKQLMRPLAARATRCSKYVFGCKMLGMTRSYD